MDDEIIFIPVSYGTRNSSSSIMALIIVIGFIVSCVIIMKFTYVKIYPKTDIDYLDVKNNIYYSLNSALDIAVGKYVNTSYNINYESKSTDFNDYKQKNASKIISNLANINSNSDNDTNTYNNLNNVLNSMNNITTKLTTLQNANGEVLQTLYIAYQTRVQQFVNDLISMLTRINGQIGTLNTVDTYKPLINPISKVFTTIQSTLVNNVPIIKEFYPTFDKTSIPNLDKSIVIPTVTNTAPDIFKQKGFT